MLAASFHADEPGPPQFLEVMRHRGGIDLQVLAQFADTLPHRRLGVAFGPRGTAGDQAQEDLQAVRIGQGLEDLGESLHLIVG